MKRKRKISFRDLDVIEWAIPVIQLQINKARWLEQEQYKPQIDSFIVVRVFWFVKAHG